MHPPAPYLFLNYSRIRSLVLSWSFSSMLVIPCLTALLHASRRGPLWTPEMCRKYIMLVGLLIHGLHYRLHPVFTFALDVFLLWQFCGGDMWPSVAARTRFRHHREALNRLRLKPSPIDSSLRASHMWRYPADTHRSHSSPDTSPHSPRLIVLFWSVFLRYSASYQCSMASSFSRRTSLLPLSQFGSCPFGTATAPFGVVSDDLLALSFGSCACGR
jgi:hypothetical protein